MTSMGQRAEYLLRGAIEDGNENGYYTVRALCLIAEAIAEVAEKLERIDTRMYEGLRS